MERKPGKVERVSKEVFEITLKGVIPTTNGSALFLHTEIKTFVIYVDAYFGNLISIHLKKVPRDRPLTHDLIRNIFFGLGVTLERVVIADVAEGTFFARIILKMHNELGLKLVEVDARPSDAILLALQDEKPILVSKKTLDLVDDMTEVFHRILAEHQTPPEEA